MQILVQDLKEIDSINTRMNKTIALLITTGAVTVDNLSTLSGVSKLTIYKMLKGSKSHYRRDVWIRLIEALQDLGID
jgi:predicted transcriptional regulator